MTDTAFERVDAFVAALEHHGHGLSIVSCQYGHEAHWPGETREYVPLHAGDLRGLVNEVKRYRSFCGEALCGDIERERDELLIRAEQAKEGVKLREDALLVGVECVLLDHAGELAGPLVDPNLAELAHRYLAAAGDDAAPEIRDALERAEELAALCERCGGVPCSECGECAGQLCRDCCCDQRDGDGDERDDEDDG